MLAILENNDTNTAGNGKLLFLNAVWQAKLKPMALSIRIASGCPRHRLFLSRPRRSGFGKLKTQT